MGILEELTSGATAPCKLCAYIDNLAPSEQAEWALALAMPNESVHHSVVVEYLRRRGVTVTEASVRRHRRNHVHR